MPKLNKRTFFGFSYTDYNDMFDLTSNDLNSKILEIGGELNTFFKHRVQQDGFIVSCNELVDTEGELDDFSNLSVNNLKKIQISFLPEIDVQKYFTESMENAKTAYDFLKMNLDKENLWLNNTLPNIELEDGYFDLVLCPFYFFVNDFLFDKQYQIESIMELIRVSNEVRIYPLLNDKGEPSDNLGELLLNLQAKPNLTTEICEVPYRLQKEANAMLKIRKTECAI